jgi:hypothetical protein
MYTPDNMFKIAKILTLTTKNLQKTFDNWFLVSAAARVRKTTRTRVRVQCFFDPLPLILASASVS